MSVHASATHPKHHFISSCRFSNGTQLCLVRETDYPDPKLLSWNGSAASVRSSFKLDGQIYKPLTIATGLLRNVQLPPPPRAYGSIEKLAEAITKVLQLRGDLPTDQARLLTFFCLTTWFADTLDLVPCVFLTSAVGVDRIRILHLLGCFCRHALVLSEVSAASLLHFAPGLQPTLLINYGDVPPRKVQNLLNAGCFRGLPIPRTGGEVVDPFGPKVVAASQPAIELEYALPLAIPSRQNGPAANWDGAVLGELAAEFQPQLLMCRLEHWTEVSSSKWDAPAFVSPVREIARSLGRCLCSDKLRSDLTVLLREQDEDARASWSVDERAIILEGLLTASHDQTRDSVFVGEAAEIGNAILNLRGEKSLFTARAVGAILKGLGLCTERLGKAGRGLRLDEKTRQNIHALAQQYVVRSISNPFQGCTHCEHFAGSGAH